MDEKFPEDSSDLHDQLDSEIDALRSLKHHHGWAILQQRIAAQLQQTEQMFRKIRPEDAVGIAALQATAAVLEQFTRVFDEEGRPIDCLSLTIENLVKERDAMRPVETGVDESEKSRMRILRRIGARVPV